MKIGIDIRNIGKKRTGDEAVFFNTVKNLAKIDTQNSYFLFTDRLLEKNIPLKKELKKMNLGENFQVIALGKAEINKFLWNFWVLPKYLRKNSLDIYHTQYITPWFISKKIKIVTTIHDVSFVAFSKFIKFFDWIFLKLLIPISLRRADKIITVSNFTSQEIIKHFHVKKEKIDVVPNAVSEDVINKKLLERTIEKTKFKFSLPNNFILYLGTLQPRKNIPFLIEAFSHINKRHQHLHLVIAGAKTYNYDREIDKKIEKFNLGEKIIFTGYVEEDEKLALFDLAQVFCFPSLYEGFGIPILEAFARKVPTVFSSIPPHKEIAGESGLAFNVTSLKDFEDKIEEALDPQKREFLINKQNDILKNFSWEKSSQKLLDIYQRIYK